MVCCYILDHCELHKEYSNKTALDINDFKTQSKNFEEQCHMISKETRNAQIEIQGVDTGSRYCYR